MKSNQAQSILRRISKIDLDQSQKDVESEIRSKIQDGDKLSAAQSKVLEASQQMHSNLSKIVSNSTDVNVSLFCYL